MWEGPRNGALDKNSNIAHIGRWRAGTGLEEWVLTTAYVNRIATAVPEHDVHQSFVRFARTLLDDRRRKLFDRMADRSQIVSRWSSLTPSAAPEGPSVDAHGFFTRGHFPSTADWMRRYEMDAPVLAVRAVEGLNLGDDAARVTHVIVTTCTGFSAPGLDLELVERCGLHPSVERTVIGFMGCYAAINALKLARHIVRSEPKARVLVVCRWSCARCISRRPTDLETGAVLPGLR